MGVLKKFEYNRLILLFVNQVFFQNDNLKLAFTIQSTLLFC